MWTITPEWKLEAGSRFEYSVISETGTTKLSREFFYPKPRLLLTWSPLTDTQVRLRYERVLGQLDFSNFVASSSLGSYGVSAGNPHLAPDRHSQYELSFEQHFWEKGAVVLTLTHEDISGVMDYIPVTGTSGLFDAPGNIGGGHKNLADLEVTLPLDRLGLTNGLLKASQIWRLTGVRDPATGDTRAISGVRPRAFQYTLTQDIDSLKSTWTIYFFTGWDEHYYRPTHFENDKVIPPYVELSWDYKPTPQWMISTAIRNAIPFGFDDINASYDGLRGSVEPSTITEFKVKSQARLYIEIRRTL
jgi:outer membrane receptor protein involved in Fe transport